MTVEYTHDKPTHYAIILSDIGAAAAYAMAHQVWDNNNMRNSYYGAPGGVAGAYAWDREVGSLSAAAALAATGWHEGADRIHSGLRATFPRQHHASAYAYDVAGDTVDVGRYCAGQPLHMQRRGRAHGMRKVIYLVIGTGAASSVTATQYENFGLAICAVVDAIEAGGARVELTALTSAIGMGGIGRVTTGWRVKRAEDPLDLAAVAFSFAHPAAHRRITFALRECSPARFRESSMGRSAKLEPRDCPDIVNDGAILLSGVNECGGEASTAARAREFVRRRINEGVGFELVEKE